jgi:hypothetical protein
MFAQKPKKSVVVYSTENFPTLCGRFNVEEKDH